MEKLVLSREHFKSTLDKLLLLPKRVLSLPFSSTERSSSLAQTGLTRQAVFNAVHAQHSTKARNPEHRGPLQDHVLELTVEVSMSPMAVLPLVTGRSFYLSLHAQQFSRAFGTQQVFKKVS